MRFEVWLVGGMREEERVEEKKGVVLVVWGDNVGKGGGVKGIEIGELVV